jgi:hypothetical protein
MPVIFIPYRGEDIVEEAVLDTIVLEPDQKRFCSPGEYRCLLGKIALS